MATAIADAGYELHVWARRPQALGDTPHVAHPPSQTWARGATSSA